MNQEHADLTMEEQQKLDLYLPQGQTVTAQGGKRKR